MTDLIDCLRLVILIVAVISKKGVGGYWMDETGKGRGGGVICVLCVVVVLGVAAERKLVVFLCG